MKKPIVLLLALAMSLACFAACAGNGDSGSGGVEWPPKDETDPGGDVVYDNSWPEDEPANDVTFTDEHLVWSDEFNGSSLDTTKWSYDIGNGTDGWGNQELQYYQESNVRVNGGKLQIMARYEKAGTCNYTSGKIHTRGKFSRTYDIGNGTDGWGNQELQYYQESNVRVNGGKLQIMARYEKAGTCNYTSGKIHTRGKFSRTYGKFEARVKLPEGTGLWPAFWMMPEDSVYGGWPRSGEIDIMEAKGRLPDQMSGALHYGYPEMSVSNTSFLKTNISEWHVYSLEWSPTRITMKADGIAYFTFNPQVQGGTVNENGEAVPAPAPFDQDFYLIFNLAVGGKFDEHRVPDPSSFGALMEVDYVRVYSVDAIQ